MKRRCLIVGGLLAAGLVAGPVSAALYTWATVGGTNDWWDGANWTNGSVPQAGDDVVITNAATGVLLTNATPYLGSFIISNTATLVFSNWNTSLSAANIEVRKNARLTAAGPFGNADESNRVHVICSNLTTHGGGQINVDAKGYLGAVTNPTARASGPGGGIYASGGSHGGYGGRSGYDAYWPLSWSPYPYGDALGPLCPGSGGGSEDVTGRAGHGGGAVRIEATGHVLVNGPITANGGMRLANQAAGGSGGSVFITCDTIDGTNEIQVMGGMGQAYGANGGGGRIAVSYEPSAQGALPVPSLRFLAHPSANYAPEGIMQGDLGTVYFPDARLLTEPFNVSGQVLLGSGAEWRTDRLTISNVWVRFPQDGFHLTVTNDVLISKGNAFGRLDLGGSVLTNFYSTALGGYFLTALTAPVLEVGGALRLTNGASLAIFSAPTNGGAPEYGSLVNVGGGVAIAPSCWVYPYSHWSNGASPLFQVRALTVSTNAGFNADRTGYMGGVEPARTGWGPGGGGYTSWIGYGGSHGGLGGGVADTGKTYGSSNAPVLPGSGGGKGQAGGIQGGAGGGLVRIEASGRIRIDGTITANGGAYGFNFDGGGAGGGIHLACKVFEGSSNGILRANGGKGYYHSGGGGRIAVWRRSGLSPEVISTSVTTGGYVVAYGGPLLGGDGTVVWGRLPEPGTVISLR